MLRVKELIQWGLRDPWLFATPSPEAAGWGLVVVPSKLRPRAEQSKHPLAKAGMQLANPRI